ncbi:MAG: hypothetical protein ACI835_000639 [Planctomycetota bacterium]|jgi:hypothetical protein
MRAEQVLRLCLQGLVLANLLFVQLTEAAPVEWLLPLYILTLLAPFLARLRERRTYRVVWNLAVVGLFALLLRHAAGHDLRYVLQDGLLLAALCQVHFLNNLGRDQRPDLLFLNSFLIALATAYLCQDLAYPIAFLAYIPMFIIGLMMMSITREELELDPRATRRVVIDGLRRSGVLLALTLLVFFFCPRDFHRQSLLATEFDFSPSGSAAEVSFSDHLELKKRKQVKVSDRVVIQAQLLRGAASQVPALWRGATLDATDGRRWWRQTDAELDRQSASTGAFLQRGQSIEHRSASAPFSTKLEVEISDLRADRLFMPLCSERVTPGRGIAADDIQAGFDDVLQYENGRTLRTPVRFDLEFSATHLELGGAIPAQHPNALAKYVALPRSRRLESALNLATRLAAELPEDIAQHEVVASFRRHLEREFDYLAPGAEGAAESLEEFLGGASGGHCELFASALATMLRSRGIACRVVTGYRSAEWNADLTQLTFRSRGAHAWVEVLDPQASWYSVDPNPAPRASNEPGLWAKTRVLASDLWVRLTSFDSESRSAVILWIRDSPRRMWLWARNHPLDASLISLALVLLLAVKRIRSRRAMQADLFAYQVALKRAGVHTLTGETPRELLERTRSLTLKLGRWELLREATRTHELARYQANRQRPAT